MRFLVDENVGPTTARWLAAGGHDVFSVYEQRVEATMPRFWRKPTVKAGIAALQKLLDHHASALANRFVVVTEQQVRFASP